MSYKIKKRVYRALAGLLALFICIYLLQNKWAHRHGMGENVTCVPLFGWLIMEDRVPKEDGTVFIDLQPGDILLTLSTHSFGWRHGHVGLALDSNSVLECITWGEDSRIVSIEHWSTYSSCAVLRVKNVTKEVQQKVVAYAKENLCGVPYRLSAGLLGEKNMEIDAKGFGMQCAYMVWYAWNHFGYDLDSDGGQLVTVNDLLNSDYLEVIQSYGMDFTLQ